MVVRLNIAHGTYVRIKYNNKWWAGSIVENINDNDRLIVVKTVEKAHNGDFLEGHGLTIGHLSNDIEIM